jgi:hypothetical protein
LFTNNLGDRFSKHITECDSDCVTLIDLCRGIKHAYREWSNLLYLEHRPNNSKYFSESKCNDYIFCYRNKFEWLLTNSISNCFSWHLTECDSERITFIDLCGRIKHADCEWRYLLSMEHRPNNSKYFGEPKYNDYIFCYRNKLKWLFTNNVSNCFSGYITECDSERITFIDLCRRIKHTHCNRRNFLPMEYGSNDSEY